MEKWEHVTVTVFRPSNQWQIVLVPDQTDVQIDWQKTDPRGVLAALNALGDVGWQLVAVVRDGDTGPQTYSGTYWLKRPAGPQPKRVSLDEIRAKARDH
jgi:hypothetical protein